jgi:hypothetical protein
MVSIFVFPVCNQDKENEGQNAKSLSSIQVKKTIEYSKGFSGYETRKGQAVKALPFFENLTG